jgi:hypothetical protein
MGMAMVIAVAVMLAVLEAVMMVANAMTAVVASMVGCR